MCRKVRDASARISKTVQVSQVIGKLTSDGRGDLEPSAIRLEAAVHGFKEEWLVAARGRKKSEQPREVGRQPTLPQTMEALSSRMGAGMHRTTCRGCRRRPYLSASKRPTGPSRFGPLVLSATPLSLCDVAPFGGKRGFPRASSYKDACIRRGGGAAADSAAASATAGRAGSRAISRGAAAVSGGPEAAR